MLALVAGFYLVGYLLAPGAIYRIAFSFFIPSKRFQRTRTEEIIFSVFTVILPYLLTWLLLCHSMVGRIPEFHSLYSKNEAYRQILDNLLSSLPSAGASAKLDILEAYRRVGREQTRFLGWLWSLCFVEGLFAGLLVNRYGSFSDRDPRKWLCDQFLLKHVSEWQILFTTITLPANQRGKAVEVDVLCGNTLYKGLLVNWFADQDGKLAGIFITEAQRFRREDWDRDKESGKERVRADYWRTILGAKLYLVASSITNYNIRYVETVASIEAEIRDASGVEFSITSPDDRGEGGSAG